jgi:hypothetical protein
MDFQAVFSPLFVHNTFRSCVHIVLAHTTVVFNILWRMTYIVETEMKKTKSMKVMPVMQCCVARCFTHMAHTTVQGWDLQENRPLPDLVEVKGTGANESTFS